MKLTKGDITCLRTATSVTFHANKRNSLDPIYEIGALYDVNEGVWPVHSRCAITVMGSVTNYGNRDFTALYHSLETSNYNREWRTFTSFLRVDDNLTVNWTLYDGTEKLRNAGFSLFRLSVTAASDNTRPGRTFLIDAWADRLESNWTVS